MKYLSSRESRSAYYRRASDTRIVSWHCCPSICTLDRTYVKRLTYIRCLSFTLKLWTFDKTAKLQISWSVNSVFVLIGFFRLDSGGGHCCVSFFFLHRIYYIACRLLLWWTCWNAVFKDLYRVVGPYVVQNWNGTWREFFFLSIGINATEQQEVKLTILREYSTLTVVGFELWCAEKLLWCGFWWTCGLVKSLWSLHNMSPRNEIKVPKAVEKQHQRQQSQQEKEHLTRTWTRTSQPQQNK